MPHGVFSEFARPSLGESSACLHPCWSKCVELEPGNRLPVQRETSRPRRAALPAQLRWGSQGPVPPGPHAGRSSVLHAALARRGVGGWPAPLVLLRESSALSVLRVWRLTLAHDRSGDALAERSGFVLRDGFAAHRMKKCPPSFLLSPGRVTGTTFSSSYRKPQPDADAAGPWPATHGVCAGGDGRRLRPRDTQRRPRQELGDPIPRACWPSGRWLAGGREPPHYRGDPA